VGDKFQGGEVMKIEHYVILAFTDDGKCRGVAKPNDITEEAFNSVITTLLGGLSLDGEILLGKEYENITYNKVVK